MYLSTWANMKRVTVGSNMGNKRRRTKHLPTHFWTTQLSFIGLKAGILFYSQPSINYARYMILGKQWNLLHHKVVLIYKVFIPSTQWYMFTLHYLHLSGSTSVRRIFCKCKNCTDSFTSISCTLTLMINTLQA